MSHTIVPVALILVAAVSAQAVTQFQALPRMKIPTDTDMAFGIAVGDVNGDGAVDYFMANFSSRQKSRLYINDGNGNFTDQTSTLMPGNVDYGAAAAMGDVDGDSDLDIIHAARGGRAVQLFLNNGQGKFTDASNNVPSVADRFYDIIVVDVDFDRDLDIVCANPRTTGSHRLFLNDGKGKFTDATGKTFPQGSNGAWGVTAVDVDGDVDKDIVFSGRTPLIYINTNFIGKFKDESSTRLPQGFSQVTSQVVAGDFDGDRDNDIYFCNHSRQNRLLLNNGKGVFSDATTTNLPSLSLNSYMVQTGDVDGDGDLDIVVGNWSSGGTQNQLYLNDGKAKFSNGTSKRYLTLVDSSTVIALVDVDGDGDLDTIHGNWGKQNVIVFNTHRHVYAPSAPQLNSAYTLDFHGMPGYATLPQVIIPLLGVAEAKPHLVVPPFAGRLGIPLAGVIILPSMILAAPGGKVSARFTVPNNGALKGLQFYVQSLMAQPPRPTAFANLFADKIQ